VAKLFGTNRVPLSGMNSRHDTHSDTLHERLYIECKRDLKYFPVKLVRLIADVEEKAAAEDKVPVIALKQHGRKGFLVLLHIEDVEEVAEYIVTQS
jgi:hypothetical protein